MRKELLVGLSLTAATVLLVLVGGWLELDITSTTLIGVTMGAVVALVPDRSVAGRLAGFVVGIVISLVGYIVRTSPLPDSESGRAVAFGLVILVALGIALAARGRVPFWAILLGAGAFAGAYEGPYDVAPPLVLDTSISAATSLLLTSAIGFLAASWLAPEHEESAARLDEEPAPSTPRTRRDDDTVALDSMMGQTR